MSRNAFAYMPAELCNCEWLESLDLSCNALRCLPLAIGQLQRLQVLNLRDNLLPELPSSMAQCRSLIHLHLGSNLFSAVPKCVASLDKLEDLDLSYNPLLCGDPQAGRSLPPRLMSFKARGCELTTVPPFVANLPALTYLNLADNSLAAWYPICSSLGELTELNLNNNNFTIYPLGTLYLEKLVVLRLFDNPIDALPPYLERAHHLSPALQRIEVCDELKKTATRTLQVICRVPGAHH